MTDLDIDARLKEMRKQTRELRRATRELNRAEADFREKLIAAAMQARGCDRAEAERIVDRDAARLDDPDAGSGL